MQRPVLLVAEVLIERRVPEPLPPGALDRLRVLSPEMLPGPLLSQAAGPVP